MIRFILLLSVSIVFSSTSFAKQTTLTLMTYNVENFFDWEHDPGKGDYTYLPKAEKKSAEVQNFCRSISNSRYRAECFNLDWSPSVVRRKAASLGAMIKAASPVGPDIIVLNEVENLRALGMLVQWELSEFGYRSIVLIEGPDRRGIDVAVLSKYPLTEMPKLHQVDLPGKNPRPTRGILEVHLNINNKELVVFANHWPSPGNPAQNRVAAARTLYAALAHVKTPYVVAAGDFNTIPSEKNGGLAALLDNRQQAYFLDSVIYSPLYADNPVYGTHWYKGHWSHLDKILVLNHAINKHNKMMIDWTRIVSPGFALISTPQGNGGLRPKRFNPNNGTGISDHLPLMMQFRM